MVEREHASDEDDLRTSLKERERHLMELYNALPPYATHAFWHQLALADMPLEVLVYCVRRAHAIGDHGTRNQIIEFIVGRIQVANIRWAEVVLSKWHLLADERYHLVSDLCADLSERILHALLDERRAFWTIHFYHCLSFERLHACTAFLRREGLAPAAKAQLGVRIPRPLLIRLDQPMGLPNAQRLILEFEDDCAQKVLLALEYADLCRLVFHLPNSLKIVVLLAFWEGRSEKEIAHLLGVSDRTVRNRMHTALNLLYQLLEGNRVHE